MRTLLAPTADPPLDPTPDRARSLLGGELAQPEYHQVDWLARIRDWISRLFDDTASSAADVPPLQAFAIALVVLLLVLAVAILVSRARRTARAARERRPALSEETVTAGALRSRAEAALAAGRFGDAVVDGFRALAVRQVERDRIEDVPQATAHELARALAAEFPARQAKVDRAADLFDAVRYGDHPADDAQARAVLDLDDELAGRRTGAGR